MSVLQQRKKDDGFLTVRFFSLGAVPFGAVYQTAPTPYEFGFRRAPPGKQNKIPCLRKDTHVCFRVVYSCNAISGIVMTHHASLPKTTWLHHFTSACRPINVYVACSLWSLGGIRALGSAREGTTLLCLHHEASLLSSQEFEYFWSSCFACSPCCVRVRRCQLPN